MKSVDRKWDLRSRTMVLIMFVFNSPALAATSVRIEKTRSADAGVIADSAVRYRRVAVHPD
jgi:hypothetical protein